MTTIATDGKSMVGDGRGVRRGTIMSDELVKVRRLDDGRVAGCCGTLSEFEAAVKWLNEGGDKPTIEDGTSVIVLSPDGVAIYEKDFRAQHCTVPAAIGSGFDVAIGAMDAGASPRRAVEIAAKRDAYTGGTITELALWQ